MKKLQTSRRIPGRSAFSVAFWWIFVSTVVHVALLLLYGIRRYGKSNITPTGPAIYVANHQSHLDPPIIGVLVADRPFSSLARASLFRNRLFAWVIRQLGAIPLEQGKGDAGAIRTAITELEAGRRVLIFPEGSRSPDGALHEFQRGVTLLLKRASVPVIPIALEGAYDIWPIGGLFPRLSGHLAVMAGKPIEHEDLMKDGPDAALERLRREIETMRLELRSRLRIATNGRCPARGPGDTAFWDRDMQHEESDRAKPQAAFVTG